MTLGQTDRFRDHQTNRRREANPLTRSYDSRGPDVRVRGTALHVAERYLQLARDANTASNPVAAENYLQHAERCCHTNLIPAARCLEGPLRLRPRWRLATSGTLRLARRGACGGM